MRKKLAVFLDGSWNELRSSYQTNVALLARNIPHVSARGVPQIVYYDEGVGVTDGIAAPIDFGVKVIGGAFGRGLEKKLEAAYRFLVLNYEPGDDLYIFGFSRGAFTARSLCGLIRACGILRREFLHEVPHAIATYRSEGNTTLLSGYRREHAHPMAAGPEDEDWVTQALRDRGLPDILPEPDSFEEAYQYRPKYMYRMMYLGVWDTVASLGPGAPKFHDTSADSLLSSLRHAVAIDEKRGSFKLTPFSNIDALNADWQSRRAAGWHSRNLPYQQVWFPGDHGAVGGGNVNVRLSHAALEWVARGAWLSGLHVDFSNAFWTRVVNAVDVRGSWETYTGVGALGLYGAWRNGRKGPSRMDELSDTAWLKSYREAYDPQRNPRFAIPTPHLPPRWRTHAPYP